MNQFFNFFLTSNVYISFAASLLYLHYAFVLEKNFFLSTPLFVFGGTYISYHLVRFIPYQKGEIIEGEFSMWYQQHSLFFKLSILITFGICLYAVFDLMRMQIFWMAIAFLIVILYENILLKNFNLRGISYLKPFIISLAWTLVCVGFHSYSLFYLVDCFLFIGLLCIPFDIKDKEFDQRQNVKTLAHLFLKNHFLYYLLIFLFSLYLLFMTTCLEYHYSYFTIFTMFLLYGLGLYKMKNSTLFYYCLDGIIIIRSLDLIYH